MYKQASKSTGGTSHLRPGVTQAEFIAARLCEAREHRSPRPITIKHYSWEGKQ